MNKIIKTAILLVFVGLICMVSGFFGGAKTWMYIDSQGVHTVTEEDYTPEYADVAAYKNIDIDMMSSDIAFVKSDKYAVELKNKNKIDWSVEDGVLKISEKYSHSKGINFNLSFLKGEFYQDTIIIYIPDNTVFENVNIRNRSGDIHCEEFSAHVLEIKNTSGDLDIAEVKADNLNVALTSGNIDLKNIQAATARFRQISGDIAGETLVTNALDVSTISGNTDLSGQFLGDSKFSSTSGDIKLRILGYPGDYKKDISILSGDFYINGERTKDYEDFSSDAANSIKAKATSGNIRLFFTE